MSTVKAVNFQHPSATQNNLVLAADGTVSGGLPSANRNLLYNGAMQVSQRGTSTAGITTSGYYTADRWAVVASSLGTWTQDIQSDAPTGSGFRRSLRMLCTTAKASPAASDNVYLDQRLEGQDLQRIAKGTASAQQLTVSFWVKSNVTGTYIAELYDNDNARSVSASYTVSASATWEKKAITFPADVTGVSDNDNAYSLSILWWLAAGSNFTGGSPLQTTWGTGSNTQATGQTNLAAATNNYWQVTGVQLEVGPVASAFEFKSYGQELRECQRYYCKTFPLATVPAEAAASAGNLSVGTVANQGVSATSLNFAFPVEMRAAPAVSTFTPLTAGTGFRGSNGTVYAATVDFISQRQATIYNTNNIAVTARLDIHAVASAEL